MTYVALDSHMARQIAQWSGGWVDRIVRDVAAVRMEDTPEESARRWLAGATHTLSEESAAKIITWQARLPISGFHRRYTTAWDTITGERMTLSWWEKYA